MFDERYTGKYDISKRQYLKVFYKLCALTKKMQLAPVPTKIIKEKTIITKHYKEHAFDNHKAIKHNIKTLENSRKPEDCWISNKINHSDNKLPSFDDKFGKVDAKIIKLSKKTIVSDNKVNNVDNKLLEIESNIADIKEKYDSLKKRKGIDKKILKLIKEKLEKLEKLKKVHKKLGKN